VIFAQEVAKIKIREGYEPFYLDSLSKAFRQKSNNGDYSQKQIVDGIKLLTKKTEQARDFLLNGEFTSTDFQAVKSKCEKEISFLEKKLPDIIHTSRMIDQLLDGGISNLKKLIISYKSDTLEVKRKIISSMYPQNLTFDGFQHRTIRINEIVGNILFFNNELGAKKNWTSSELSDLSSMVVSAGIEPATQGFSVLCSTD
jgi:site-specific DNA recombinase